LSKDIITASLIFAAGKGSRMKGFEGNKTLLPLLPGNSCFEGRSPILLHILDKLPPGPKALIVNHRKEDVIDATKSQNLAYLEQPVLNGTGGALLAARPFIESTHADSLIITMGDIPLVEASTYRRLVEGLGDSNLMVLGFEPEDKKQYGLIETDGNRVSRIIEWKYWRAFSKEKLDRLQVCNAGIYAVRKSDIIRYLRALEMNPHRVLKERKGKMVEVEEFFITDMIELMHCDGLVIGWAITDNEWEVMGVDDLVSLQKAQSLYKEALSC
jgi:bifunctional UDP-N-acetylglucosamine pyrophosphorylase/glucosamine-1-phosphate N-acetyltransferase